VVPTGAGNYRKTRMFPLFFPIILRTPYPVRLYRKAST
jgi:hypothetical protein